MNLTNSILNTLIDKYESSKGYFSNVFSRKISFKAEKMDGYLEDYQLKDRIHRVVSDLDSASLISYTWERFEENNILDKIILNIDEVDQIYKRLNRIPLKEQLKACLEDTGAINELHAWAKKFKNEVFRYASDEQKWHPNMPKDDEVRENLIKAINGLQEIDELTERLFSIKYLGDSKIFEKTIKRRLCSILRKSYGDEYEDDHLFEMLGLYKNYDEVLVKGELSYLLEEQLVDVSVCINGTSINSDDIKMMRNLKSSADRIITIENKAVYHQYRKKAPDNELVIYLGGFFGKYPKELLLKLTSSLSEVKFYHWGDIDLGGVSIYAYMKVILGERLSHLNMDVSTIERYKKYAQKIEQTYLEKLVRFRSLNPDFELDETVKYLVENEIRLEQEAIVATQGEDRLL